MTGRTPTVILEDDIVSAWKQALTAVLAATSGYSPPLMVSIRGGAASLPHDQHPAVLSLDALLGKDGRPLTMETAFTILPYRAWDRRQRPDVVAFSNWCTERLYPRMRARNRLNCYGTYFQRMMAYPHSSSGSGGSTNQLSHVVEQMKKPQRTRESALQMSILHPARDHTGQTRRGFPCLQQVGVSWIDDSSGFAVNAFYPTQHLVYRALGNYIGLTHLGDFLAYQTGREFLQLNCYVGSPSLSQVTKATVRSLATADATAQQTEAHDA